MRQCTVCKQEKPLDDFPLRKDSKRHYWQCKICNMQIAAEWNKNNSARRLAICAKQRAQKYNLPCTIDGNWVVRNMTSCCPCCNMPFRQGQPTGRGKKAEDRPSLDRVDPAKGYTEENTRIICTRCNKIKNAGSAEDHIRIAKWLMAGAPQNPDQT